MDAGLRLIRPDEHRPDFSVQHIPFQVGNKGGKIDLSRTCGRKHTRKKRPNFFGRFFEIGRKAINA